MYKYLSHAIHYMYMLTFVPQDSFLADRTAACSMIGYWHHTVVCLSVMLCTVPKRYILQQKCQNK